MADRNLSRAGRDGAGDNRRRHHHNSMRHNSAGKGKGKGKAGAARPRVSRRRCSSPSAGNHKAGAVRLKVSRNKCSSPSAGSNEARAVRPRVSRNRCSSPSAGSNEAGAAPRRPRTPCSNGARATRGPGTSRAAGSGRVAGSGTRTCASIAPTTGRTSTGSWAQRGGYGGTYIPRDCFYGRFGGEHPFRLRAQPVIYQGYPRFRHGGFSFLFADSYPEAWRDNWYYTDDVYIGFDDGDYLYNRNDPSVAIAITVMP